METRSLSNMIFIISWKIAGIMEISCEMVMVRKTCCPNNMLPNKRTKTKVQETKTKDYMKQAITFISKSSILDKTFRKNPRNSLRLERTRKPKHLFVCTFWLFVPRFSFFLGGGVGGWGAGHYLSAKMLGFFDIF